jgi:hypothetical protein
MAWGPPPRPMGSGLSGQPALRTLRWNQPRLVPDLG